MQVREWSAAIRKQQRVIDRQINSIKKEEDKVQRSLKDAAKKGQKDVCSVLAKEVVNSHKAVKRLYTSKAQLKSVEMQMKNQLAVVRLSGALEKSTIVMKSMQSLCKVSEIQSVMVDMSKEMMKAGIIEEMMEDTFESLEDQDELEDAAQEEIDKVLFEITAGALGAAPGAVSDQLPEPAGAVGGVESEEEDAEEDLNEMQARLEALRS
ncbi:charged multivesicular body protein 3-like isoform X2 [Anneissia japonica]|uniref:charged multivesicular body protein 3-like isoform X2 n=1 Tax=Anneissia japonica TaxID=1529436 RepID=UPI0014255E68|nr:charged multivesicular body protein 3-like isoform X2 [Anneissia japonica]